MQNLLSKRQKKHIRIGYYLRLASVVAFLLSGTFMIGVVALLPSYLKVVSNLHYQQEVLETRKTESQESKNYNTEIEKTVETIAILEQDLQKNKLTTYIEALLHERPEGISLLGFSYDRERSMITLEGFSKTRDIVAPFARSLEESPFFSQVPVPISDLAKNKDLNFRLQVGIEEENTYEKD